MPRATSTSSSTPRWSSTSTSPCARPPATPTLRSSAPDHPGHARSLVGEADLPEELEEVRPGVGGSFAGGVADGGEVPGVREGAMGLVDGPAHGRTAVDADVDPLE